jgi:hypothetical protein
MGMGIGLGLSPVYGGGPLTAFSSFGSLVCLYDFTRANSLFTNTSRTTGVSADGDVIAGVTDLANGSYHLSQSDGTATPTYRTNVLNGRSVARFDGVNDFLQTAANFGTNAGLGGDASYTTLVVSRKTLSTNGMLFGWGNVFSSLQVCGFYDDGSVFGYGYAGSNYFRTLSPTTNTWYVRVQTKAAGAINATTTARRNGADAASTGHSTNTPNVRGSDSLSLGRWGNWTSNQIQGDIALFAIYSGIVSDVPGLESFVNAYLGGVY